MTRTPDVSSRHPLISTYLHDLDRALAGADPAERADTLASIGEHIQDRLGELGEPDRPTAADVRTVLAELGPVERIAGSATPAATPEPLGRWVGPVALGLAVLSVVVVVVNYFVALALALGVLAFTVMAIRRDTGRDRWVLRATAIVAAAGAVLALVAVLFLTAAGTTTTVPDAPVVSSQG